MKKLKRTWRIKKNKRDGMSSINMTSMMDLMCVLLIVFMIATPAMYASISVKLPKFNTQTEETNKNYQYITITLTEQNEIYIENEKINEQNLLKKIATIVENGKIVYIFIKADQNLSYGKVMNIVSTLDEYGYERVSFLGDFTKNIENVKN